MLVNIKQKQKQKQKDDEYFKFVERMLEMQKRVDEIKSNMCRKKQQKENIIKEYQMKMVKLKLENQGKDGQIKLQQNKQQKFKQKQKQIVKKKIKENQIKKNKIQQFRFQKISNCKKKFQTQTETESQNQILHSCNQQTIKKSSQAQKTLILEQKQSSIIQDLIIQMPQPDRFHHYLTVNPYSPRNNIYYVSEIVKAYQDQGSLAREHIVQSLQIMRTLESSKMPPFQQIMKKKLNLARKNSSKKVLVFDLDETLIHCNDSLTKKYDFQIEINLPGSVISAGVNIRPYAKEILKNLHIHFEIIIFTASQSCYADQVIKILDPNNQYISHKLFRQHCILTAEGMYIKDLRIIDRPLAEIVLIDNAAYSYHFQVDNGVPIIPYYHGSLDFQLKALQRYLMDLMREGDVRKINRQTFQLHKYSEYYNKPNKLVEDLYISRR